MYIQLLLIFSVLLGFVAMHNIQVGMRVPAADWERCEAMNNICSAKLADIHDLLVNATFTSLVSGGNLKINCSLAEEEDINHCMEDALQTCRDYHDHNVIMWRMVHTYICNHSQAFIAAELCLTSGTLTEARSQCNVGEDFSEELCSAVPLCVEDHVTNAVECTTDTAQLFRDMIRVEYALKWFCAGVI